MGEYMNKRKTCFFIGHHDAPADLAPILAKEVERHITEYGVTDFIVGMYWRFDQLAARAVIAAKKEYPSVSLGLLLPYHPAERRVEKPAGFDVIIYPSGLNHTPRRYAIIKANRKAIDEADFLIAYVTHPASNASKFLEYAQKRQKAGKIRITNLGDYQNYEDKGGS